MQEYYLQSLVNAMQIHADCFVTLQYMRCKCLANIVLRQTVPLEYFFHGGYNKGMGGTPEPKTAQEVTTSQLEALASDLEDFAQKLRHAAKIARSQETNALAIFNWASALTGVKALRSFVAKADESRSAAELGTPISPGQLKPRSTAKSSSKAKAKKVQQAMDREAEDFSKSLDASASRKRNKKNG